MRRVAVLGGSFDPIHKGHVALAKLILKKKRADEVWFMPALVTPLKDRRMVSYDLRCKMIKAAISPYRKMKLSRIEEHLPVPSYTINTVRELKKRYPNISFSWIIGDDQAAKLDQWKYIEELRAEIRFLCVHREGNRCTDSSLDMIDGFSHPASSTLVRAGKWSMVCDQVRKIIIENGLYIDDLLEARVSKRRAEHTRSMTEVAVKLAKAHGVNEHKAWMAGMLHDIAKEVPFEEAEKIMKVIHPEMMHFSHKVWHQWLAEDFVRCQLKITDKDILSAIGHHVLGDGKSALDKIIYIADKIDPSRGYNIDRQMKVSLNDLDEGLKLIKEEQRQYLRKQEGIDV